MNKAEAVVRIVGGAMLLTTVSVTSAKTVPSVGRMASRAIPAFATSVLYANGKQGIITTWVRGMPRAKQSEPDAAAVS